jgi:integrase
VAHIEKRGPGRYRARYLGPNGRERSKTFQRKIDAERFLATTQTDLLRGSYVDPNAGRVTFTEYAERWRIGQVQHSPGTAELVEGHLRRHVLPTFGSRQLRSVLRSDVQAWVADRSTVLAPSTLKLVYSYVATIFRAAAEDRLIPESPCRRIQLPRVERTRVAPLPTAAVNALIQSVQPRWQAALLLAAGTGMRQGEVLGLTLDRVDFLRRQVRVDRQLRTPTQGPPEFGPPKTEASVRTLPLPDVVLNALAEHQRLWPAAADGLLFVNGRGTGMRRQRFIDQIWKHTVRKAKLPEDIGFHELRHYYASLLIAHGESVKVVQARLGHKSALETLDTYGHLWPDSEDSTRAAVDLVLGSLPELPTASARPSVIN